MPVGWIEPVDPKAAGGNRGAVAGPWSKKDLTTADRL